MRKFIAAAAVTAAIAGVMAPTASAAENDILGSLNCTVVKKTLVSNGLIEEDGDTTRGELETALSKKNEAELKGLNFLSNGTIDFGGISKAKVADAIAEKAASCKLVKTGVAAELSSGLNSLSSSLGSSEKDSKGFNLTDFIDSLSSGLSN